VPIQHYIDSGTDPTLRLRIGSLQRAPRDNSMGRRGVERTLCGHLTGMQIMRPRERRTLGAPASAVVHYQLPARRVRIISQRSL